MSFRFFQALYWPQRKIFFELMWLNLFHQVYGWREIIQFFRILLSYVDRFEKVHLKLSYWSFFLKLIRGFFVQYSSKLRCFYFTLLSWFCICYLYPAVEVLVYWFFILFWGYLLQFDCYFPFFCCLFLSTHLRVCIFSISIFSFF